MTTAPPTPPASPPTGRTLDHPARAEIRLHSVLHALADPMRLSVVRRLAGGAAEQSCSSLELPVSKSTSTHHFRVLRESGVLRQTYRGTAKMNALRRADLDALFPGLLDSVLAAAGQEAERGH
ncbi:helix-turn-helix transcriptional regulator [Streptomyces sp. TRM 70351]|uniref:ArsR/SmtB family transcription factor n=1 Tax=Streptomyces sp. TRM 70351 TaxID=3116552 RepID=UPI002E7AD2BD|nr:helix-turn-helix transcriptional regulator [Streptomyces sp. TRM 70351]MEE1927240.1 helix-turn-helix transcriptional regulator [Streptomyces sp. TRM 70351]